MSVLVRISINPHQIELEITLRVLIFSITHTSKTQTTILTFLTQIMFYLGSKFGCNDVLTIYLTLDLTIL